MRFLKVFVFKNTSKYDLFKFLGEKIPQKYDFIGFVKKVYPEMRFYRGEKKTHPKIRLVWDLFNTSQGEKT